MRGSGKYSIRVFFPENRAERGDDVDFRHDWLCFLGSRAIRLRRLERIYTLSQYKCCKDYSQSTKNVMMPFVTEW